MQSKKLSLQNKHIEYIVYQIWFILDTLSNKYVYCRIKYIYTKYSLLNIKTIDIFLRILIVIFVFVAFNTSVFQS